MPSAFTVPSELLIEAIAKELKEQGDNFQPPKWAPYVKLGVSRENSPETEDWWYIRTASILRKIYINGPIGIIHLRKAYGGRKNRGRKPNKSRPGSGSVIRKAVQQLEKAGLVVQQANRGRIVTAAGRSFVDKIALKIQKTIPELAKY